MFTVRGLFSFPARYISWLQKDNPVGVPDRFPELKNRFETSVPGIYCIGDLTGIPLVKLAAESGYALVEQLAADPTFLREQKNRKQGTYDLVIIGAGPAGVAASLQARKHGIAHIVIEAAQPFSTIANFPANKPIYVTPAETPNLSSLTFRDGTKETLLEELHSHIDGVELPVKTEESVVSIQQEADSFTIETTRGTYRTRRVVVGIGKTGNPRRLGVAGEDLPKVYNRLIDPGEFTDTDICVVGGGDSAVEAAVALAKAGNRVTVSYRKEALHRPRPENRAAFDELVAQGAITPRFASTVTRIQPLTVSLKEKDGVVEIPNQVTFVMIGSDIPIAFFRNAGIRVEGEKRLFDWIQAAMLLLFAALLYFGKKAPFVASESVADFFSLPWKLAGKSWPKFINGALAWGSLQLLLLLAVVALFLLVRHRRRYFSSVWDTFKYSYYIAMLGAVTALYLLYKTIGYKPLFGDMDRWYTILYSLTIVLFGIRRMVVRPTGYIKRQTITLILIQVVPLCILPLFVFPFLGSAGLLPEWVMNDVFPGKSYWRSFGFILAWPLFIHNLATGVPTTFWLIVGLLQTFVLIPVIVYRWGKGAYCGWICSCGALAETLGDEYRETALHGRVAKRWDNVGQGVLLFSIVVTILAVIAGQGGTEVSRFASRLYGIFVDIFLAGVLGVGVYFILSGRVWCRFFCPLAALMHIYARFTVYRIFAQKKRCISCGICTRVCHMGIDVMGYANRGIPMNDVECVRCSACVVSCPMEVLTFGNLGSADPDNVAYKQGTPEPLQGWESGLPKQPSRSAG